MADFKQAFPKNKPFECCAAWHLWKSGQLLAIYDFLGRLTNGGECEFFSSIAKVTAYFGMNYESTRRAFKTLRKMGWIDLLANGNYRYISHEERAKNLPKEKCAVRETFPWQESTNPFVGKIWSISGGKIRLVEWHIQQFEKHIGDEEAFLVEFKNEMAEAEARRARGDWQGTSPKSVYMRVFNRLKEQLARCATVEVPAYK